MFIIIFILYLCYIVALSAIMMINTTHEQSHSFLRLFWKEVIRQMNKPQQLILESIISTKIW